MTCSRNLKTLLVDHYQSQTNQKNNRPGVETVWGNSMFSFITQIYPQNNTFKCMCQNISYTLNWLVLALASAVWLLLHLPTMQWGFAIDSTRWYLYYRKLRYDKCVNDNIFIRPWRKKRMSQTHLVKKLSAMLFFYLFFNSENELSPMRFWFFFDFFLQPRHNVYVLCDIQKQKH